jgi:hypothetical protein
LETPACLGRRFWLAERASQKPDLRAKEHAARDDPMILEGLRPHMEHERGAFKVNYRTASGLV